MVVIVAGDAERPENIPTRPEGSRRGNEQRGNEKLQPARLVATVGAVIGLCIVGDSLLYTVLPLQGPALGLSLPQVGLLLSATGNANAVTTAITPIVVE